MGIQKGYMMSKIVLILIFFDTDLICWVWEMADILLDIDLTAPQGK